MEAPTHPPKPPVIEMDGVTLVSRQAPGTVTVRDIHWTVAAGDFWVIGGLQGSGKSDLLAAAAALATPQGGTCRLFGREVTSTYDQEGLAGRLRAALVFGEGGRLFSRLTVWENVALPLSYHRPLSEAAAAERVAALLEATETTAWSHALPSAVSRSWRQRVALARALALAPEVLLLDNPLAGLDPRQARWWTAFLGQLSTGHALLDGRPLTVVVAADDLRPWQQPGRRFALLEETRFILLGDPFAPEGHTTPALRELLVTDPNTL